MLAHDYGITNTVEPPAGPFTGSAYNPVEGGADLDPDPSTYGKGWSLEATQLTSPDAGQTDLWSDDEHLSEIERGNLTSDTVAVGDVC